MQVQTPVLEKLLANATLLVRCLSYLDLLTLFKFGRLAMSRRQWASSVVQTILQQGDRSMTTAIDYTVLIENDRAFVQYFHSKIVPLVVAPIDEDGHARLLKPFAELSLRIDMQRWNQKNTSLITPRFITSTLNTWRKLGHRVTRIELPMCDALGWSPSANKSDMDAQGRGDTRWIQYLRQHRDHLTSLGLNGCNVTDAMLMDDKNNPMAKHGISCLNQLRDLNLSFNTWVSDLGIGQLKSKLPHLEKLDLSYTSVSDMSIDTLITYSSLEQLHLMGTRITSNGLQQLVASQKKPAIKRLNLFGCSLTDLKFLRPLSDSLEALCISWSSLSNAEFPLLNRLKELVICDIKSWDVKHFRHLFRNGNLQHLETLSLRMESIHRDQIQSCMEIITASVSKLKHFDLHIDRLDLVETQCLLHLRPLLTSRHLQHFFLKSVTQSSTPSEANQSLDSQIRQIFCNNDQIPEQGNDSHSLRHLTIMVPHGGITIETLRDFIMARPSLEELCVGFRSASTGTFHEQSLTPNVGGTAQLRSLHVTSVEDRSTLCNLLQICGDRVEHFNFTDNDGPSAVLDKETLEKCIIGRCPNIRELELTGCSLLTDQDIHSLKQLGHLTRLSLSNMPQLTVKAVLPLGNSIRNLTQLQIPQHLAQSVEKLNAIFRNMSTSV